MNEVKLPAYGSRGGCLELNVVQIAQDGKELETSGVFLLNLAEFVGARPAMLDGEAMTRILLYERIVVTARIRYDDFAVALETIGYMVHRA